MTHLSTGDVQIDLTTVSTHKGIELLANTLQNTQPVVLGQGVEEVLEDVTLVTARELLELSNDLLLVSSREGRGADDRGQLAVRLQGLAETSEGPGDLVEGRGLDGGSVLFIATTVLISFDAMLSLSSFFLVFFVFFCEIGSTERGSYSPVDTRKAHKDLNQRQTQKGRTAYQSSGIGAINTEQGHGSLDVLGGSSVGPQGVDGGGARNGELLGSGTQARAGENRKHGGQVEGCQSEASNGIEERSRANDVGSRARQAKVVLRWW